MARNGSGVYTPPATSFPAVSGTLIEAAKFNETINDIGTALTGSLSADGQTTATGNQPMSGYRHTGVGNGVARNDYPAIGQVQDGKLNWVDGGGTANAITATYVPPVTALVDGQLCCVRATAANSTTTPTFSPNGLTARTIVQTGGVALEAGNIAGDGHELLLRYDLTNTRWELLNPKVLSATNVTGTIASGVTGTTQAAGDNSTKIATTAFVTAGSVPAGMIMDWPAAVAPSGWVALPLVPTNVSRTGTYARVFANLLTTWGAGDGSTTFGIPYCPENYAIVQANGNVTTTTTGEVKAHTHTVPEATSNAGTGSAAGSSPSGTFGTSSTGGAANLAAGMRMLKVMKL